MLDVVIAELLTLADAADSEPTGATCRLPLGETIRSPILVSSILSSPVISSGMGAD